MQLSGEGHEGHRPELVKVTTHAIIGGGFNLREGQVVPAQALGEFTDSFRQEGAIEPVDTATE